MTNTKTWIGDKNGKGSYTCECGSTVRAAVTYGIGPDVMCACGRTYDNKGMITGRYSRREIAKFKDSVSAWGNW